MNPEIKAGKMAKDDLWVPTDTKKSPTKWFGKVQNTKPCNTSKC